jgi:5'(3')-deoxyribonucleotidase
VNDANINRTIFVDLDGVLIDWDGGFRKISGGLTGDEFVAKYDKIQSIELIKRYGSQWWANLEWLPDGKELWQYITSNFLNVKILTATGRPGQYTSQATKGKIQWMRDNLTHLSDKDKIIVGRKGEKERYCKPGDILVDDNESNIQDWINAGGIGILHRTARNTISQLKEYDT